jgi:hypothetical protein
MEELEVDLHLADSVLAREMKAGTERRLSFWIDADATVVTITAKR